MADDRYERTTMHGKTVDKWTAQALTACEKSLGYPLTIVQGSYSTGVSASAGTHAGGGVVDLAPADWQRKVLVLRQHGFAAWHRVPSQGPWSEHVHAVLIGDTSAAASAQRQVAAYRAGKDGLASNRADDGPRVSIKEFPYMPKTRGTHIDNAIAELKQATRSKAKVAAALAILRTISYLKG